MTQRGWSSRFERDAQQRRARARAHLARVQTRRQPRVVPGRRAWALLALLAGVWLGPAVLRAAVWVLPASAAHIDHIRVRGAVALDGASVARATGLEAGAALREIDPQQVVARLSELPGVRDARALRLPLGPLLIRIEERVAVAVARSGERAALVDASATAFEELEAPGPEDLPRLELPEAEPFTLGEPDPRLAAALELAYGLPERDLPLPEAVGVAAADDPEGFSLRLPGLAPRVVLGRDEHGARLAELSRLLDSGIPELGGAASLDLRFADRAVLREGPSQGGTAEAATSGGGRPSPESRPAG